MIPVRSEGQVEVGEPFVAEQSDEHGRDAVEGGAPFLRHRVEGGDGVGYLGYLQDGLVGVLGA